MLISATSGITPDGAIDDIWLRIDHGVIKEIGSGQVNSSDLHLSGILIPGFIDIHCHGGGGYYFSDSESRNIRAALNLHRDHGTTLQFASLVTDTLESLSLQISNLLPLFNEGLLAGIHLEGPYLSSVKCGAHNPQLLRTPEISEIQGLLELGEGAISMVTIAPELPGAINAISFLSSQGVIAAVGHTDANADQIAEAISAGATVVTHFNNAMQKLNSGETSASNYLLADCEIPLEAILDGVHLSSEVSNKLTSQYSQRTIAVTDAMSAAGCTDGNYYIGSLPVLVKDRVARLAANGALAGSTLTMLDVFENLLKSGVPIERAVAMTSQNAADLIGAQECGRIEVGAVADLLHYQAGVGVTRAEIKP